MPLKGENPITTYFPRVSSNPQLKTPVKPQSDKRPRQLDEISGPSREHSRKKSKGRKQRDEDEHDYLPAASVTSRKTPRHPQRTLKKLKPPARGVIEIQDTPQSSPVEQIPPHRITPPSSPLPDLTPSPDIPPKALNKAPGPSSYSASMEASYLDRCKVELELIPSSQTQTLDSLFCYEGTTPTRVLDLPSSSVPACSPEPIGLSQSSNFIPSSQPDATPFDLHPDPGGLIVSSQSQAGDQMPTSPIDPDSELVPSSQTQELFYSQGVALRSPQRAMRKTRPSRMDIYIRTPQTSQSNVGRSSTGGRPDGRTGNALVGDPHDLSPTVPNFQGSAIISRPPSPNWDSEQQPSTQASEIDRGDEPISYESLPDAVKELQGMFGDTYESYPPDFPMSLR